MYYMIKVEPNSFAAQVELVCDEKNLFNLAMWFSTHERCETFTVHNAEGPVSSYDAVNMIIEKWIMPTRKN